ncbi:sigma-70 family RNA polymerase sigma factor (plasmid) [Streptomyces goshikiensis]|uniref:sigma-70 family RNA polymerase sigma factor n=1 Tax=Streptomyces goshikiensis TaxID=1942 RepID=UPI002F911064|nr:sigma-70 family RNA polymerase sigma factor [Streptomyces goshikiensis]
MEVKPQLPAPLGELGASILPWELSAFHDAHRLDFIQYARIKHVPHEDAEDVVSKAFLTLYQAGQSFLTASKPQAFAFKVLKDTIADHFRRSDRRPRTQALTDEVERPRSVDGSIDDVICRTDVERALDSLPPRQADCLRLSLLLELPRQQIAQYLGISPSAVSSHLSEGRRELQATVASMSGCSAKIRSMSGPSQMSPS